jgi:large subunit ribosomal protein L10
MNRDEKTAVVDRLAEDLSEAQAIFAVDYKGISVPQAAELRSKLRESDASFKVVKNRLAKLAAQKAGTEIDELLTGPIALTLINGDPVVVAKTITTFTREHDVLSYRGGLMDGAALDVDGFQAIARLPGLDVLHGQLVGLAASPLTGLVAGMNNLIAGLGRQLAQIAEQGLVTGEAPEPESPVEEPTPAEEPAPEPEAQAESEAESEAEAEEPPEQQAGEPEAPVGPPAETSEADGASDETESSEEPSEDSAPEGEDSEDADSEDETPKED